MKTNWQTKKLGEVAAVIGGYAFKSKELRKDKRDNSFLPVVKIGNLGTDGCLHIEEAQFHKFDSKLKPFLIRNNDVLIAMTGATVGKVAISDKDNLLLNQRVGIIRPKQGVLNDYLKYLLLNRDFYKYCQKKAGGGAQGNISPTQILLYRVNIPSLLIQQQIVERLDAIRKLQELNNKEIEKAEELFDSLLSNLLRHRKSFKIQKLGELTSVITKGTTPTTYGHSFTSKGVPFLRVENVNNDVVNPLSVTHYINESTNKMLNRSRTQPNDVLVTIAGTIGRMGYIPIDAPEMNMNQAVAIVRTNPKLLYFLYLFYLLQSREIQRQMLGARVTGTITNISLATLRNLMIPVVPIDKQFEIATQLGLVSKYKQQIIVKKDKLSELFESALNKAMKGELVN